MTLQQGAVLGITLLLMFWVVGAHNRLVALRNRIGDAWAQIDEQLRRRKEALPPLVSALREPLAGEHSALDAVLLAQAQVQAAADRLRGKPVQADASAALVAAEGALGSAQARLLALMEQQAALREQADIAEWKREIQDADQRLGFARQLFNDAVAVYNAAAHQFPTRAVARLFGFGPAGAL